VNRGLARRYARALLSLARTDGNMEDLGEELARVATALEDDQLKQVLENPALGMGVRDELLQRITAALAVSKTLTNAVRLLGQRDRIGIVSDIARAYRELLDREIGRTRVVVRTATPLSDAELLPIEELARKLARQAVVLTAEVEPELLGGAVLDVGGVVYDGSIKTQLRRMAETMTLGSR